MVKTSISNSIPAYAEFGGKKIALNKLLGVGHSRVKITGKYYILFYMGGENKQELKEIIYTETKMSFKRFRLEFHKLLDKKTKMEGFENGN